MFGSTVVMKAAKKGYKRYGIPGAVVAGAGTFLGIRFVKNRFLSGNNNTESSETTESSENTGLDDVVDSVTDTDSGSSSN